MKIKKLFVPDAMFNDIYEISAERISSLGKKAVIFDIDNTVAPYEAETPTDKMKDYFSSLLKNKINIAFVSNNEKTRTEIFNKELGFYCVSKASKPSPNGIKKCIKHFKADSNDIILVGDQIYTDCLAAHLAGIHCFLVKPINDKKTFFFRFKRFMEKPFIKICKKKGNGITNENM